MLSLTDQWRNRNEKFVFWDVETNGLNLVYSQPYQLSYIIVQGGKVIEKVDDFIWWDDYKMPQAAAQVNRFDRLKYERRAQPLDVVMKRFEEKCRGAVLVGHNVLNFDVYMLNMMYAKLGIKHDFWFMDKIVDTNALAKSYLTKRKNNDFDDWEEFVGWQLSSIAVHDRTLKSSQGFMLKHFDIDFDPSRLHEALYDVEKNKEVFEKLLFTLKL